VLAPGLGYPGDSLYREFYRRDEDLGLHFWRVTGVDVPLDTKALYDPYPAFERAEEHARHWLNVLHERLRWLSHMEQPPVVVVTLDAEFFGHWWFEGIAWLRFVLRELHTSKEIRVVTLSNALAEWQHLAPPCPAHQAADCGANAEIAALWRRLEGANRRMAHAARTYIDAEGLQERLLTQAARELLLAASGDWFALIANGSAVDYARRRFDDHIARFERLLSYAECNQPPPEADAYLAYTADLDNPFPRLNFRIWG
jgi:1,4-alpha-glucan branching enzyme